MIDKSLLLLLLISTVVKAAVEADQVHQIPVLILSVRATQRALLRNFTRVISKHPHHQDNFTICFWSLPALPPMFL